MRDYSSIRLTENLVNMTDRTIRLYEETTGEIRRFPVSKDKLPVCPVRTDGGEISVHYVYEKKEAERIKKSKRKLDDVAVISERTHGRGGREIVYLVWAKDMETRVILHDNVNAF